MSRKRSQERTGEIMILSQAMIYGFFPVIISYAGGLIPPIFFAAVSILLASVVMFFYLLFTNNLQEVKNTKSWKYILGVTFFSVILGFGFVITGASLTSGVNTSILLLAEVLFTFFICGLFFGEKMPLIKILAAILVVIGTFVIMYNGDFVFNKGDILIVIGTAFYPIGNRFAKKAMNLVQAPTIIFVRSVIGGLFLLLLSFYWEATFYSAPTLISDNSFLIIMNALIGFSLTKVLWYEGMKRMDISKSITIGMSYAAFGVLYSMIFLGEVPTQYQILGFIVVFIGIFLITYKSKTLKQIPSENI